MAVVPLRIQHVEAETGNAPDGREGTVNPDTGGLLVMTDDGGMEEIDEQDWRPSRRAKSDSHYANLVDELDPNEVARIGDEVWRGVTADIQSRRDYMEMTAEAIRMLGLRLDPPRSDAGGSGAPLEGMSTVRHPLLLEACLRVPERLPGRDAAGKRPGEGAERYDGCHDSAERGEVRD